jgi:hypothetical protein
MEFVAAPMRQWERCISAPNAGQFGREVGELVRNEMHNLAFSLNAATHGKHACGEDNTAPFEQFWPYDEVGDAGLVFDGDEHDALGGAMSLPDEDDTGRLEPFAVAGVHGLATSDNAASSEIGAKKRHWTGTQSQAYMPIILEHFAAGGHGPERDCRLSEFEDRLVCSSGGRFEKRKGLVAKTLDLPKSVAAGHESSPMGPVIR